MIVGQRHSNKAEAIEYEQNLLETSNTAPLSGRVHWLGRRADVPQLMRESTLVLHLAKQEPLGRVLLEAAASGAVVVATEVGGTSEIFQAADDEVAARLILPDDATDTAATIRALLADDELCRQLGKSARSRAVEQFSANQSAEALLGHYHAVR